MNILSASACSSHSKLSWQTSQSTEMFLRFKQQE